MMAEDKTPTTPAADTAEAEAVETPVEGEGAPPSDFFEIPGDEALVENLADDNLASLADEILPEPPSAGEVQPPEGPKGPSAPEAPKPAEAAPKDAPQGPTPKPEEVPSPPAAPSEPVNVQEELARNQEAIIESLATEQFQLSQEEIEALQEDAVPVMQRMAARVYYQASVTMLRQLENFASQRLPALINQHRAVETSNAQAETEFFEAFPSLKEERFVGQIQSFAQAFRTANPKITKKELHQSVGNAVLAVNGMVPQAASPPKVPPAGNGAKPAAFRPAPSGVPVISAPVESPFDGLGRDFEE